MELQECQKFREGNEVIAGYVKEAGDDERGDGAALDFIHDVIPELSGRLAGMDLIGDNFDVGWNLGAPSAKKLKIGLLISGGNYQRCVGDYGGTSNETGH